MASELDRRYERSKIKLNKKLLQRNLRILWWLKEAKEQAEKTNHNELAEAEPDETVKDGKRTIKKLE